MNPYFINLQTANSKDLDMSGNKCVSIQKIIQKWLPENLRPKSVHKSDLRNGIDTIQKIVFEHCEPNTLTVTFTESVQKCDNITWLQKFDNNLTIQKLSETMNTTKTWTDIYKIRMSVKPKKQKENDQDSSSSDEDVTGPLFNEKCDVQLIRKKSTGEDEILLLDKAYTMKEGQMRDLGTKLKDQLKMEKMTSDNWTEYYF